MKEARHHLFAFTVNFILVLILQIDWNIVDAVESDEKSNKFIMNFEQYLLMPQRYQLYCEKVLNTCSGHGRCLLEKCFCDSGWTGANCDALNDSVIQEPCVELACYSDDIGGYYCNQFPSDACHYNPDYGVLQVPYERWIFAQRSELSFWEGWTGNDDRNEEHLKRFNFYQALREANLIHLGHILEFAAGPFTQTKTLLQALEGGSVNSITLLEPQLMEYKANVSGCSYKDNKLLGRYPVNFLVGGAEKFVFSEVYDTVIMINTIEHCQDGFAVLNNLFHSIKPGGVLIWHERAFPLYEGKPYRYHRNLLDFIFHPLRVKLSFWEWFLLEHFEPLLYRVEEDTSTEPSQTMIYFIGRKKFIDKGIEYILSLSLSSSTS